MIEAQWNQTLNRKLKRLSPELRIVWKLQVSANTGVLDNYYLGERSLWMEAKLIPHMPVRRSTLIVPDLSEKQHRTVNSHFEAEGNGCVVVAVKKPPGTVPGYRGASAIPFINPTEWQEGITPEVAEQRLHSYDSLAGAIHQFCQDPATTLETLIHERE